MTHSKNEGEYVLSDVTVHKPLPDHYELIVNNVSIIYLIAM